MITIKEGTMKKIKDWSEENIYILADFDRTLTVGSSESSWGILSKSHLVPKKYKEERQELYNYYRSIELDEDLDYETKNKLMCEWWMKHINLFVKYQLTEEVVDKAIIDPKIMTFRDGAKDFLMHMHKKKVPVIIISAGIGNFIEQFLIKNNCYFDNVYVISNFIKFESGIAVGISDDIIHSLNKNEVSFPKRIKDQITKRSNVILLGDMIGDIRMVIENKRSNALKIGFLEDMVEENKETYENNFDIVCTDNTSFTELLKLISFI